MKPKILLVEDETDLGNVVKQYLEVMDFHVDWCKNGSEAYSLFRTTADIHDLLLIDVGLPGMDGFELAELVTHTRKDVPFLFLTARNEKSDRLHGLKIGADDYIVKPFDIEEMVLRIRNILKRKYPGNTTPLHAVIAIGNTRFHKDQMKLIVGNEKEIILTERESELLNYLFKNADRIIKREEILTQLWGENDYFLGRSLDVFISRLRKYLGPSDLVSITNIYGVGFVFNTMPPKG